MSILANADANALMRIRAEEVLERKGTGVSRQAGELAGQFSAMLEQLNGVGDASAGGGLAGLGSSGLGALGEIAGASPVGAAPSANHRLGIGAVSVFAQSTADGPAADNGQTPDFQTPTPDEAMQVVQSAMQAQAAHNNFRWLTTLLTQTGPQGGEAGLT